MLRSSLQGRADFQNGSTSEPVFVGYAQDGYMATIEYAFNQTGSVRRISSNGIPERVATLSKLYAGLCSMTIPIRG